MPLTKPERIDLGRQCRFKRFTAGEHIIDMQADGRDVHFVLEGTVRVVNYSPTGREVTLDDIGPGGYFGELAAIDGGPRSAFVMPQGGWAVTAAMPSPVFLALMARKPQIGLDIMRRLARMVRQSDNRIMDLSTLGAQHRIQAELMRQAAALSSDGRTAMISPIPLHADLASRVSTTRETVARVLNDLARDGIVERQKNALVVRDLPRLTAMVEDMRSR
ncbi:MAG TPA: Crp/Fnr family transcriptional regulator [Magnetospirillaceae bacterium]|jgi:CRP-like cAMP-binding protein